MPLGLWQFALSVGVGSLADNNNSNNNNGSGFNTHRCDCVVFVSLFPVMLLPVSCYSTSRRPCECLESCYVSVQVMYLLDMLFLN